MELRRARAELRVVETLDRPVVERAVRDARLVAGCDREAVVLRGDEHLARAVVEHRMVRAAMTERQLEGLLAGRHREQLMTEADTEHRHTAEQLLQHLRLALERRRVTRARRQE